MLAVEASQREHVHVFFLPHSVMTLTDWSVT